MIEEPLLEKGNMQALDKHGNQIYINQSTITLEWYKTSDHATMIQLQKKALPVLSHAFADEVRDFLLDDQLQLRKEYAYMSGPSSEQEKGESAGENPFIASARLDREKRVEFSSQQWEQWFKETALAMENLPFEYFLILAKNDEGKILGVVAFYRSPQLTKFFPDFDVYSDRDVVLDPLAIEPSAQGHGLSRSLVFSILKLAPETKRILVGTRIWITNAIAMYKKFGFVENKQEGINVQFIYETSKK